LHKKNKNSKVAPLPDPVSEYVSEQSLYSYHLDACDDNEVPQNQNIPLNRHCIKEKEEDNLPNI
jgi:hypothetical protein